MDTENNGIIEAFVKDPIERPIGVLMWQVFTFPDRKKIYVGGKEVSGDVNLHLLRLWQKNDSTRFVTLPIDFEGKSIRVRISDLLPILEKHA